MIRLYANSFGMHTYLSCCHIATQIAIFQHFLAVLRKRYNRASRALSWAVCGLIIATLGQGCALSPQSVVLRPVLNVTIPPLSQPRTIALTVLDMRSSKAFGVRGGIYDTALITPRTDVAQTLRRILAERLQSGNFRVIDRIEADDAAAALSLEVRIERINYGVTPLVTGGLLNEVRVEALFQAIARNGERTLSGQYQAVGTRQINGYLNAEQNEALLNEVVGKALQNILADHELMTVLRS